MRTPGRFPRAARPFPGVAAGRPRPAEAGFSLIEILFAIAFLGIGLLATAQMIPLAMHQVVGSKQITDASAAGQTKMEELRMEDYSSTLLTAGTHADTTGRYSRSWVVTDGQPAAGSKRVDLTVTWSTSRGIQQTRLSTFISR